MSDNEQYKMIARLQDRLASLEDTVKELKEGLIEFNELKDDHQKLQQTVQRIQIVTGIRSVNELSEVENKEAEKLYWRCSPRQHAIIQLIFYKQTSVQISERIGTTEGGARSQIRYLCGRLAVSSRQEIIHNYKEVWTNSDDDEYLRRAKIPKDWFDLFGGLSFKQAEKKDEYFTTICKTNYRSSNN